jgi:hypothetical protein
VTIPSVAWCHPRPRPDYFVGSFPRGFEGRLVRLIQTELGNPCEDILSLFSGLSEHGVSVDLNASTTPDYVADCHDLGFLSDESFDVAIADPPYSVEESELLYSMPPPRWGVWTAEAVRVLKTGGHLVVYLDKQSARPAGTKLVYRIALWTRTWHTLRAVQIFQKLSLDELAQFSTKETS